MERFVRSALIFVIGTAIVVGGARLSGAQKPPEANAAVKFVTPNANLVAENIPPVPAALAEEVSRYAGAYGLPLAGWHPSKRELWLKGLSSSVTWLSRVESPGATAQTFVYIPAGLAYDVYLQPQAKYLLYNIAAAGDEQFQLYLYDIAARQSTLLTDGRSRNTEPVWSRAGDRFIYGSASLDADGVSLYTMNPLDLRSNKLVAQIDGAYLKAYDWSPDDRQVIYAAFTANTASTLWLLEVASGKSTPLTPRQSGDEMYYSGARFKHDGSGVYVITDRDSDVRRLAYLDIAAGGVKFLTGGRWDVEQFQPAPDGRTIAYAVNEDGVSRLYLRDEKSGEVRPVTGVPLGVISDLRWHTNSVALAFNLRSPRAPLDVYVLDTRTGALQPWARSVYGGIDPKKLVEPELIRWKSFDGLELSGFLYRPQASFSGKRPVIVDLHGGPLEQYRPVYGYTHNYFLNELGVAIIYPNVRGSKGYGKRFASLDDGVRREDSVSDVGALLDWIGEQPGLDADRVLVRGASYGGYLALSVAAKYGDRIRAAVSDSGISNLASAVERNEGWDRAIQRVEFGDERDPKTRAFLERIAPVNNADKIKVPLLVIHGTHDSRVKVSEAEQVVRAVKAHGGKVWFLLGKNEGHGFTQQSNRDYQLCAEILFAKEFLLK